MVTRTLKARTMPRVKATPTRTHQAEPQTSEVARADTANVASGNTPFTVRVRHPNGTDRFSVRPAQTVGDLRQMASDATKVAPLSRVLLFLDVGCTEPLDDDDETLGRDGLALEHGDMLSMQVKPVAARKAKAAVDDAGGSVAKRPKGAPAKSGGEYLREGKTPRDIAVAFMMPDGDRMSGEGAYSQMAAAARLDAVLARRVELNVQRKGRSATLSIRFTGNRKAFEERTPCYSFDELVGIVGEITARQTTSRRRTATSASHLLNAEQLARRSPAMFWSVHALGEEMGASWEERLQSVLNLAAG